MRSLLGNRMLNTSMDTLPSLVLLRGHAWCFYWASQVLYREDMTRQEIKSVQFRRLVARDRFSSRSDLQGTS
jgi:hypothetical protein